jgi:hypothetical protein
MRAANPNSPGTYNPAHVDAFVDYGAAFNYPPVQDGIKLPRRQEVQLGYQQTYDSGWSADMTFKYRKLEDVLEDSVFVDANGKLLPDKNGLADNATLGGEPAVIWNPGSTLKYHGFHDYGTPGNPDIRTYFSANYVLSRFEGNYQGLVSSSNGQPDANITASFDYWPYVGTGLLPLDHTHTFKMFGSYLFDLGAQKLILGANFFLQTGNPISHFDQGNSTFGDGAGHDFGQYGNDTPVNLQLGQFGRRPTVTRLDLHAEMDFVLVKGVKLAPYLDVLNACNARMAIATNEQVTDLGGSTQPVGYLDSPNAWQTARSFRMGAKLRC